MTDQRDQRREQGDRQPRQDLAAMLHPLTRALVAAELPVLARHGISMWGYVVLNALEHGPARTQAALAQSIGADKTRIIATLDELQQAGLISREPDPADRRIRLLAISAAGRQVRAGAQSAIQANEERVLARLPAADRQAFLRVARILSELPPEQIAGPLIRWPRPAAPGNVGRTNRPEEVRPITAVAGWALPASMDVRLT
jgi:DNA-binding MarR family transcriptional regulator